MKKMISKRTRPAEGVDLFLKGASFLWPHHTNPEVSIALKRPPASITKLHELRGLPLRFQLLCRFPERGQLFTFLAHEGCGRFVREIT